MDFEWVSFLPYLSLEREENNSTSLSLRCIALQWTVKGSGGLKIVLEILYARSIMGL
jgi:hypothetical protein